MFIILHILTTLAIAGLCTMAHLEPVAALPAGGFAAALMVNLSRRLGGKHADILGALLSGGILLLDRFNWATIVFIPSLLIGCLWHRMPQNKLDADDRIYLPGIGITLGIGIIFLLKKTIISGVESITDVSGLTRSLNMLTQILDEGGKQLTGDSQKDYFAMVEELKAIYPYYFLGGQVVFFTLAMNLIMRIQRLPGVFYKPFIFFKIKERYVFLLIFAMGVEIFRYLLERKDLLYISRPIFIFLGATYFIGGLAVLGYMVWASRQRTNSILSRWFLILLCVLLLMKPIIASAIGLLDIWFDFRKLKVAEKGDEA